MKLKKYMLILIALGVVLSGCHNKLYLPKGKVIDANTSQPIAGAYVLILFSGEGAFYTYFSPDPTVSSARRNFGSMIVQTDEFGNYDFTLHKSEEPWTMRSTKNQRIKIVVYAPGYLVEYPFTLDQQSRKDSSKIRDKLLIKMHKTPRDISYDYLDRITSTALEKNFTMTHWMMGRAILREIESLGAKAVSLNTLHLCKMLNNSDNALEKIDCSVYDEMRMDAWYKAISKKLKSDM